LLYYHQQGLKGLKDPLCAQNSKTSKCYCYDEHVWQEFVKLHKEKGRKKEKERKKEKKKKERKKTVILRFRLLAKFCKATGGCGNGENVE
jgi:hypothetical protein